VPSAQRTVRVELRALHADQQRIADQFKRFNVIACGRRWGKSELSKNLLIVKGLQAARPVAWFSPTFPMLTLHWREIREIARPVTKHISEQDHRIDLLSGGRIDCWSLESAEAARGHAYARVVLDEAAKHPRLLQDWNAIIRPTLTDFQGDAFFPSTPRGLNDYWMLYQRGVDPEQPEWSSAQAQTAGNPFIAPEEIEAARAELPADVFAQEYLAEFISDATLIFRNVRECSVARPLPHQDGHHYTIGADWGKLGDFTVFSVFDATARQQVALERSNLVDYHHQIARLRILCEQFKPYAIFAERNSMGEPIIEQATRMKLPIYPFITTNQSKMQLIEALALALDRRSISILPNAVQQMELLGYTADRTQTGLIRYGAPSGGHDDTVIALALSYLAACSPPSRLVQRAFRVVA
jgi:hypothetical protein